VHVFVRDHIALYLNLKSKLLQALFRRRYLVSSADLVQQGDERLVNQFSWSPRIDEEQSLCFLRLASSSFAHANFIFDMKARLGNVLYWLGCAIAWAIIALVSASVDQRQLDLGNFTNNLLRNCAVSNGPCIRR
jgi:hypothetical protein